MRRTPATLLCAVILGAFMSAGSATAAHATFGSPAVVPNCPANPNDFVEYEGLVYFWADLIVDPVPDDDIERGIYSFDGTACTLVNDDPDFGPTEFYEALEYDGLLYLVGYNPSAPEGGGPGVSGYAPYSFDGATFELLLGDGLPQRPDEECYNMVLFDDELYCTAYNGEPDPLYSWNGTSWTDYFADGSGDVPESMRSRAVLFEGVLYMIAQTGGNYGFYSYDGTTFTLLSEADDDNEGIVVFDGRLFVVQGDGPDESFFEWDGTDLTRVAGSTFENIDDDFVTFDGFLYFDAEVPGDGRDNLYRFNGSAFERVTGGLTGDNIPSNPTSFVVFDGQLLFTADGLVVDTLYAWNGTAFEIVSTDPIDMDDPIVYQGVLYFAAAEAGGGDGVPPLLYALQASAPEAAPELADTGVDATAFGLGAAALIALLAGVAVLARRPAAAPR